MAHYHTCYRCHEHQFFCSGQCRALDSYVCWDCLAVERYASCEDCHGEGRYESYNPTWHMVSCPHCEVCGRHTGGVECSCCTAPLCDEHRVPSPFGSPYQVVCAECASEEVTL